MYMHADIIMESLLCILFTMFYMYIISKLSLISIQILIAKWMFEYGCIYQRDWMGVWKGMLQDHSTLDVECV